MYTYIYIYIYIYNLLFVSETLQLLLLADSSFTSSSPFLYIPICLPGLYGDSEYFSSSYITFTISSWFATRFCSQF